MSFYPRRIMWKKAYFVRVEGTVTEEDRQKLETGD